MTVSTNLAIVNGYLPRLAFNRSGCYCATQMKALVTGASGFIGSTLIGVLNERGVEVRALLRKTSSTENLKGLKYESAYGSLSDFESLKKAVDGVDFVFHLAGVVAAANRQGYLQQNTEGTAAIAKAISEVNPNLKRFVFLSSLAAGGPMRTPKLRTEQLTDSPVSAYGESKLAAEQAILKFKDRFPIVILRPPIVYGPRDRGIFVIIKTVNQRLMPVISGANPNKEKVYSIIYVDDLVEGIYQSAMMPEDRFTSGDVFYVAEDRTYTYEQILLTAKTYLGRSALKITVPRSVVKIVANISHYIGEFTGKAMPLNRDKLNEILPDYWVCSNAKARSAMGFSPRNELDLGMKKTVEWYRANGWL